MMSCFGGVGGSAGVGVVVREEGLGIGRATVGVGRGWGGLLLQEAGGSGGAGREFVRCGGEKGGGDGGRRGGRGDLKVVRAEGLVVEHR